VADDELDKKGLPSAAYVVTIEANPTNLMLLLSSSSQMVEL
jgi:hypothetical protein